MRSRTALAKRSMSIDLEYATFKIEAGKTYTDDGTTVFDVYLNDGLADGSFEETKPRADTIIVSHPESRQPVGRISEA